MAVTRIKLLGNKREVVIRQMRRDIALLLESGQDAIARIRVAHVIREQNIMAANELIELFCELIVSRLAIIAKQRECPPDLKEGISSLIFAGPRCLEIPELLAIRDVFLKKYGKDFVSTAADLRPNAGVNRLRKCDLKHPPGDEIYRNGTLSMFEVNASHYGTEHIVPSIVQLGFGLLHGVEEGVQKEISKSDGLMGTEELGTQVLKCS